MPGSTTGLDAKDFYLFACGLLLLLWKFFYNAIQPAVELLTCISVIDADYICADPSCAAARRKPDTTQPHFSPEPQGSKPPVV